jgi:carbon monoxide dehydrogenase subunit G
VLLRDKTVIRCPRVEVWEFLLDPDRFASCIPGVEQVRRVDDRTFDGTILASVGPISGSFDFRARIVESTPPSELAATITGTDSVTKSTMTTDTTVRLTEADGGQTELDYQAQIEIGGRMAILGDMVVRATATLLVEEFMKRVREQLEGKAAAP